MTRPFRYMACVALLLMMTSPLFLGTAHGLEVTADDLSLEVVQGGTLLFHFRGQPNETLTLHANRLGPAGQRVSVPLGALRLDENGTASFSYPAAGDLATVGPWELVVANETTFVKVRYTVEWDPVYLVERELALLARQEAFWASVQTFVVWVAAALVLSWAGLRLWHEWSHIRPTFLGPRLASALSRLGNLASVTEMGLQAAVEHPVLANRTALLVHRRARRRGEKAIRETVERLRELMAVRRQHLEREAVHRDRVLQDNPGDPLVEDFAEDPAALEKAVRAEFEEVRDEPVRE